jgi:hypothetical protein
VGRCLVKICVSSEQTFLICLREEDKHGEDKNEEKVEV